MNLLLTNNPLSDYFLFLISHMFLDVSDYFLLSSFLLLQQISF